MRVDGLSQIQARARAEVDLFWFARNIMGWKDLDDVFHGQICRWLEDIESAPETWSDLCVPRKTFKTTLANQTYIPWRLMCNPNLAIAYAHATREGALKVFFALKQHLELNEKLKWMAPDVFYKDPRNESPMWTRDSIIVKRARIDPVPSVMVTAPDAPVTGFHFHLFVLDDVTGEANYKSKQKRESVKSFVRAIEPQLRYDSEWNVDLDGNRLQPKCLNIDTPWHHDDHSAMIAGYAAEGDARFFHRGMFGERGREPEDLKEGCILPELFPPGRLRKMKFKLKNLWSGQILCHSNPKKEAEFDVDDLHWYPSGVDNLPADRSYAFYTAEDPNRTVLSKGDHGVVLTAAVDHRGDVWVIDMRRGHPDIPTLVEWIVAQAVRYRPQALFMETVGYQQQLRFPVEDRLNELDLRTSIVEVSRGAHNRKDDRIRALSTVVRQGQLHLPYGIGTPISFELEHWQGDGSQDDTLDCIADIVMNGRRPRAPSHTHPRRPERTHSVIDVLDAGGGIPQRRAAFAGAAAARLVS